MAGNNITVNYAAMESAASAIQNSSRQIEERLSQLASELNKLDWDGDDRAAYMAAKAKWDQAIEAMNTLLNQIGGAVNTARQGYSDVERAGAAAWG
jgi:WXG100 family type VII secretion target